MYNLKGPQIAKTILKSKNKIKGFPLPDFKTQSCGNENSVVLAQRDRYMDQWNKQRAQK